MVAVSGHHLRGKGREAAKERAKIRARAVGHRAAVDKGLSVADLHRAVARLVGRTRLPGVEVNTLAPVVQAGRMVASISRLHSLAVLILAGKAGRGRMAVVGKGDRK